MENVLQNPNVTLGDLLGGDLSYPNVLSTISFPKIGKDNIQKFLDGGLLDENNHQSNMGFLKYFQYCIDELEINLNEVKVVVLSKFTSLLIYNKGDNFNTTYCGLKGMYSKYVSTLMESINKIDLSKINMVDVIDFKLSDEKKIFFTDFIEIENDENSDESMIPILGDDCLNYLFHLLPQYLPSDVNFYPSIMGIINDDNEDISFEFREFLEEKSTECMVSE